MKKNQKKFTFSLFVTKSYNKKMPPPDAISWRDHLVNEMVRKGYLVKNIQEFDTITIQCSLAKANVPFEERLKLQKEIEK